ncbi:MAG: hypothetical protein Q7R65_02525, partial [bacterium]|nr:hypothetical protein [bacterium]
PDVIGFGNEIISGEQGTVELHYTDGSSQLFSLADGSPLSAPPPPPPLKVKVEVKPYVSEVGVQTIESERLMVVRLTVTGVPPGGLGGRIIIEFCENLSYGYWQNMGGFDNFTGNMFSTLYEPYAQMRFYRARPALPGE